MNYRLWLFKEGIRKFCTHPLSLKPLEKVTRIRPIRQECKRRNKKKAKRTVNTLHSPDDQHFPEIQQIKSWLRQLGNWPCTITYWLHTNHTDFTDPIPMPYQPHTKYTLTTPTMYCTNHTDYILTTNHHIVTIYTTHFFLFTLLCWESMHEDGFPS